MDPSPESPSDGGLAIFGAQRAIYHRALEGDYMSHRALFGFLHGLLKARSAPFRCSIPPVGTLLVWSGASWREGDRNYFAMDLSEPVLSVAPSNARSLSCATQIVHQDFHEYVSAASRLWEIIFIGFLISPP